jgi:hypothetical protein
MKKIFLGVISSLVFSSAAFAEISVSPMFVNFGSVRVHQSSFGQTIYVTNRLNTSNYITVSGSCFGDFQTMNFCNGYLPAYASCNMQVTFRPSRKGTQSCTINIQDSVNDWNTVSLSGTGI